VSGGTPAGIPKVSAFTIVVDGGKLKGSGISETMVR
jgi:hypothetical protein